MNVPAQHAIRSGHLEKTDAPKKLLQFLHGPNKKIVTVVFSGLNTLQTQHQFQPFYA